MYINNEEMEERFDLPKNAGFEDDGGIYPEDEGTGGTEGGSGRSRKKGGKSKTPALDSFSRDLTEFARLDKLDPVIGRDVELDMIIQILNKRKKNNPIIIGEPGIGKTAIAEALAIRISKKDTDPWLHDKRIVELNITDIVSGTKYRGQFEERMKAIIEELKKNPDIIVFIDEIHMVLGAGSASGSMDAANILKPILARGEMTVIGATTLNDYKKSIENDTALARRFQKVVLQAPTEEETFQILKQIRYKYEDHHRVTYSDEVIEEIINLTDRYINYRNFPDKGIDVMDEAGSVAKLAIELPDHIIDMQDKLRAAIGKKEKASDAQNYEEAAVFRDEQKEIEAALKLSTEKWEEEFNQHRKPVTVADVAQVISSHTGIPLNKLTDSETDRMSKITEVLSEQVVGQAAAVEKVALAIQRSRLGIQNPNKPASFLFLGPTGVGKTHLAKTLSKYLFDRDDAYIRFDMSEYMEKFSATRLIGAPPGFIGYDEKGELTEKVKNQPYSILLFDEIEKAHKDVFNLFLSILDDGHITDSSGSKVNFKNCIIIMTSNIGTAKIASGGAGGLGFSTETEKSKVKNVESLVFKELEKEFTPEFINRIDEKIVFNVLDEDNALDIVNIEIDSMINRLLKDQKINITIDKSVRLLVAEKGFDEKYGARPLKRAITQYIENEISNALISGGVSRTEKIKVSYDKKKEKINVSGTDTKTRKD
jgi:ATP-dependent Clp protease ATP-binding subunit ClpC